MKSFSFCFIAIILTITPLYGQDNIFLINGDQLLVKVIRHSAQAILFTTKGNVETEISTDLVNNIVLENGQKLKFNYPFTLEMQFDVSMAVIAYSKEMEQAMAYNFGQAVRKDFHLEMDNTDGELTMELFRRSTLTGMSKRQIEVIGYFRFLASATNAFAVTVQISGNNFHYTFYSQPISPMQIKGYLLGSSYKLVDSKCSDPLRGNINYFTMSFLNETQCEFKEDNKEPVILNYAVSDDGTISFWDQGRKKEKGTTYKVVAMNERTFTYTRFAENFTAIRRTHRID